MTTEFEAKSEAELFQVDMSEPPGDDVFGDYDQMAGPTTTQPCSPSKDHAIDIDINDIDKELDGDDIFGDDDFDVVELTQQQVPRQRGVYDSGSDDEDSIESRTNDDSDNDIPETNSDMGDNQVKKHRLSGDVLAKRQAARALREANKAAKAAERLQRKQEKERQKRQGRQARQREREEEKKRRMQQQLLGMRRDNGDDDDGERPASDAIAHELNDRARRVLESELEANRILEAEMSEERRKLIEAQEIDEDEAAERIRRLTQRAMRDISGTTGRARSEERQLLRNCRLWMRDMWSTSVNSSSSRVDREYLAQRLGVEIQKFYGISDQNSIDAIMNSIHAFVHRDIDSDSASETDSELGNDASWSEDVVNREMPHIDDKDPGKDGESLAKATRNNVGQSPIETAAVIYFSDSDLDPESESYSSGDDNARNKRHDIKGTVNMNEKAELEVRIDLDMHSQKQPNLVVASMGIDVPSITPIQKRVSISANDQLRAKLAARRPIAQAAAALVVGAGSGSKMRGKAALLQGLRQRVAETSRMNICLSHKLVDAHQLVERNTLTEKCRQLVELFRSYSARREDRRRRKLRISFQQTAAEGDGEFDDGYGAVEEILSEEQQRQLRESFLQEYAEMEDDEDDEDEVEGNELEPAAEEARDGDEADSDSDSDSVDADADAEGNELQERAEGDENGDGKLSKGVVLVEGNDQDDNDDEETLAPRSRRSRPSLLIEDDDDADIEGQRQSKELLHKRPPRLADGNLEAVDDNAVAEAFGDSGSEGEDEGGGDVNSDGDHESVDEESGNNESDDDLDNSSSSNSKAGQKSKAAVGRNNLFRLQLLEEARREKIEKSRLGAGLIDAEAEEDEEQGRQAGLGDFGFTYLTNNDAAEEAAAMVLRQGDLDHIVDDVSDGEGDEEAGMRARLAQEEREDRAKTRAVITAVTEGFGAQKRGARRAGFSEDALLIDRNEQLLNRSRAGEGDGEEGKVDEDELDFEELLTRGLSARQERERKYQTEFEEGLDDFEDSDDEDETGDGELTEGADGLSRDDRERLRRRQLEKRKAAAAKQREFEELLKMRRALRRSQSHLNAQTQSQSQSMPVPMQSGQAKAPGPQNLALQLMGAPAAAMSLALDDDDDDKGVEALPLPAPLVRSQSLASPRLAPLSKSSSSSASSASASPRGVFTFDNTTLAIAPATITSTNTTGYRDNTAHQISPRPNVMLARSQSLQVGRTTSSSASANADSATSTIAIGTANVSNHHATTMNASTNQNTLPNSGSGAGSSLYRGILGEAEVLGGYGMGMAVPQGRALRRIPTEPVANAPPGAKKKRIEPIPVGGSGFTGVGNIAALATSEAPLSSIFMGLGGATSGSGTISDPTALRRTLSSANVAKRRCIAPGIATSATGISLTSHAQHFVFTGAEDSQLSMPHATTSQLRTGGMSSSGNEHVSTGRENKRNINSLSNGEGDGASGSLFAKLQAKSASGLIKRSATLR